MNGDLPHATPFHPSFYTEPSTSVAPHRNPELAQPVSQLLDEPNYTKLIIYSSKMRHTKNLQGGCEMIMPSY
jgi:hypothetical protein